MERAPINLVHITTSFGIGGAERLLLDLCRSLDRARFHIRVVAVVSGGPMEAEFKKLGIETKVIGKKSKLGIQAIRELASYLHSIHPTIVHTHLFGGDTWGRIAAVIARVPVIISTEHNINKDEGPAKRAVKKILSLFTDRIIAVSEGVRQYSIHTDLIAPQIISVIYNGIDLERFSFRGARAISKDTIRAAVIGRLAPQKGHSTLLQALPQVMARYPGFRLDIVGDGELAAVLKQQVRDLGISEFITFTGAKLVDAQYLSQLDLIIIPSLWEGFGMVAAEAQAVGVPVVAADIPGLNEVVRDKETGVTCAPGDPSSIAQAIEWAIEHPSEISGIVQNARSQAEKTFSLTAMVDAYTKLYESLADK